jgi:hypothetical protein
LPLVQQGLPVTQHGLPLVQQVFAFALSFFVFALVEPEAKTVVATNNSAATTDIVFFI